MAEQAQQLRVFVSHASADNDFCRQVVQALRDAGADVWYDEQNLGPGVLRKEIMRELAARPVFLVILSKAAFASDWVQDECEWAYNLYKCKPERLILPVVAAPCDSDDFDTLLYLESMKRVEAGSLKPYPPAQATTHLLRMLALTPRGEAPAPIAPQPTESADDLLTRGKALSAQDKHTEALPLFERATQRAPNSIDSWVNLAYTLNRLGRHTEAAAASDRLLAIDPNAAVAWTIRGLTLSELKRYDEALDAFDQSLALDSNAATVWAARGITLNELKRHDEALAAFDHGLTLDPDDANAWANKGFTLLALKRADGALIAFDQALTLDPAQPSIWVGKGVTLHDLGRTAEANDAMQRARELGWEG